MLGHFSQRDESSIFFAALPSIERRVARQANSRITSKIASNTKVVEPRSAFNVFFSREFIMLFRLAHLLLYLSADLMNILMDYRTAQRASYIYYTVSKK